MQVAQNTLVSNTLNLDQHYNLLNNQLTYLLNGDISDFGTNGNTFVQNARGNDLCFNNPDYVFKGSIKLDKDQFALFFKTLDSYEIGILDSTCCAYVPILTHKCLNLESEISGTFNFSNGSRVIYWRDGINPLRYLNLDECPERDVISDCKDCERVYGSFNCDSLNIFKCVPCPQIKLTKTTGNLPNGVYQVALAYYDDKSRYSQYYIYPETITFHTNNQANNSFGINLEILGCIDGFDKFEVVLISHRNDRATLAQRVGVYDSYTDNILISEIDPVSAVPISFETLFSKKANYKDAKFITSNNEMLVLGGVMENGKVNYQPQAKKIKSKWLNKKVPAKDAHKYKSFMRGEVYPFYIRGVRCTGEVTEWFHIPSDAEEKIKTTNPSYWDIIQAEAPLTVDYFEKDDTCDPKIKKYWQLYDTSRVTADIIDNTPVCVRIRDGVYYHFENNCDAENPAVSYEGIYNYLEITVLNKYCEPVPSAQDISIDVTYESSSCGGGTTLNTITHTLLTGQSSFIYPYVAYQLEDCGTGSCLPFSQTIISKANLVSYLPECDGTCEERPYCEGIIEREGDFAYWESELTYPDNPCVWCQRTNPTGEFYDPYGLSCQNIRYHKFPENCNAPHYTDVDCNGTEFVYILDIEFSNIQPFLDKDGNVIEDITGYEIGVGDRTNHKSILHKGLIYNMWEETLSDCTTSYYANYPFNDLNPDPFLSQETVHDGDTLNPNDDDGFEPATEYAQDRFQYISPDISYIQDDSGSYLQIYQEANGTLSGSYHLTPEFPKVVFLTNLAYQIGSVLVALAFVGIAAPAAFALQAYTTYINSLLNLLSPIGYALTYYCRSVYKKWNCNNVIIGNIRRKIDWSQYMLPIRQYADTDKINNFQRESGLYLKLHANILDPSLTDNSRFLLSDNMCKVQFSECSTIMGKEAQTSSYYAGVKVDNPNQYGDLGSHAIRTIQQCFNADSVHIKNGGDIYVTKHKYIRKFPFFTNLPIGLPDKSDYSTSPYFNVWKPRFWMDTQDQDIFAGALSSTGLDVLVASLTDSHSWNFDKVNKKIGSESCEESDDNTCRFNTVTLRHNGKFYTYVIGEAHYWAESEFIGDYRELNEIPESNIDRDIYSKINYRTIQYPELFLYDLTYHWKGLNSNGTVSDKYLDCCKLTDKYYKNRIAYSQKSDPLSISNNWLNFRAESIQQFDLKEGEMTVLKAIDTYNLFIGFEDAVYITQADESLYADSTTIYIGTPNIFERRLKKVSDDVTGYGGCIDPDSVIPTRYGVFWFDRKRKKFLNYSNDLKDITSPMQVWFNDWMNDEIYGVFDNYSDNLYYTSKNQRADCSWTLSYKPKAQGFISFHSFIPDYYIGSSNNFFSVKNNGIWKHNSNKYQNYYGNIEKFEVGININHNFAQSILQSIELHSEFYTTKRVDGYDCKIYDFNKFFDEAFVYNHLHGTGSQKILLKEKNNENHYLVQNVSDYLEATYVEDFTFRLNGFKNRTVEQPTYCLKAMTNKTVKPFKENGLIRGKWYNLHLISNTTDVHKILVELNLTMNEQVIQ